MSERERREREELPPTLKVVFISGLLSEITEDRKVVSEAAKEDAEFCGGGCGGVKLEN